MSPLACFPALPKSKEGRALLDSSTSPSDYRRGLTPFSKHSLLFPLWISVHATGNSCPSLHLLHSSTRLTLGAPKSSLSTYFLIKVPHSTWCPPPSVHSTAQPTSLSARSPALSVGLRALETWPLCEPSPVSPHQANPSACPHLPEH